MKALLSPASPFARKVRIVLRETGLTDRVEEVLVTTSPLASHPDLVAANPSGRLPVLLRDDGPALADSRVITRFLDDLAGGTLYPEGRIWEVLTLEALADGIMDSAVLMAYEARLRPEAQQSAEWVDAQWGKVARSIAAVEDRWMSHLEGPLDAGQIALACALTYVDFRHGARNWRDGHAALAEWLRRIEERPAMVETRPA